MRQLDDDVRRIPPDAPLFGARRFATIRLDRRRKRGVGRLVPHSELIARRAALHPAIPVARTHVSATVCATPCMLDARGSLADGAHSRSTKRERHIVDVADPTMRLARERATTVIQRGQMR